MKKRQREEKADMTEAERKKAAETFLKNWGGDECKGERETGYPTILDIAVAACLWCR